MARRLTTDAKIVLERAGYHVIDGRKTMTIGTEYAGEIRHLFIDGGTVDSDEVVKLLNARDFDEFGYKS